MNFLFVKASSLGDIIHTFPAAAWLKKRFPEAKLDWIVEKNFAELLHAHPLIDKVIEIDSKKWRKSLFSKSTWEDIKKSKQFLQAKSYDAVFDMQGNTKSSIILALARSKVKVGFGWQAVSEKWNCLLTNQKYTPAKNQNIREDNLRLVQHYFNCSETYTFEPTSLIITPDQERTLSSILNRKELLGKKRILVCPGSAWTNKQMENESLKELLKEIQSHYDPVFLFLWGTPTEKQLVEQLSITFPLRSIILDKLPLPTLQNLMGQMDLVLAMDSLPLHLAETAGTPTFGIFGASSAQKYAPQGSIHEAFQGKCPYGKQFIKRCPILRTCETGACIRKVSGKDVYPAINRLLQLSFSKPQQCNTQGHFSLKQE